MRILVTWFLTTAAVWAQDPELGHIDISSHEAVLTVDSGRPLDSVAKTLAQRYGIIVNSEDAEYLYSGDMKDVTAEVVRTMRPGLRVFVPKGGHLEVRFPVKADGSPQDLRGLLQAVIDAANAQFPFAYRLDVDGDAYTFIPTTTRDAQGRVIGLPALLDRKITIPLGTRSIIEHARLMTDALSAQTGFHISCCQSVIAGFPWGMDNIAFEARDEPARSVLLRLIRSVRGRYYYLERCDPVSPGRPTWCFINVQGFPPELSPQSSGVLR
jgi:hypothetical protein